MASFPNTGGVLLLLLTVGCTSPQNALLWLLLLSAALLVDRVFSALMRALGLPLSTGGLLLFSLGAGSALCLALQAVFPDAPSPTAPLTAALLLTAGAFALNDAVPAARILPTVLIIGALRELLAEGMLWGIELLPMELSPAFGSGVGGLLVGALVLWCFGLNRPVLTDNAPPFSLLSAAGLTLLGSVLGLLTADWPTLYALWVITAAVCLIGTALPECFSAGEWLIISPVAALLAREGAWWTPLLLGGFVAVAIPTVTALHRRLRLCRLPRRFAGVPSALTVTAVVVGISTAI